MVEKVSNFLNSCPAEIRKTLQEARFSPGEIILSQGDPAKYVYILLAGEARVYHMTLNGINFLEYIYGEEGIFGEIEILYEKPVLADVVAQSDCRTMRMEKEGFIRWMRIDPNFALFISQQLAEKFYQASLASATHMAYPLKYCILYLLWSASSTTNPAIPKEDLINRLGSNERSINRIVKELVEAGLVENEKGLVRAISISGIMGEMRRYET